MKIIALLILCLGLASSKNIHIDNNLKTGSCINPPLVYVNDVGYFYLPPNGRHLDIESDSIMVTQNCPPNFYISDSIEIEENGHYKVSHDPKGNTRDLLLEKSE